MGAGRQSAEGGDESPAEARALVPSWALWRGHVTDGMRNDRGGQWRGLMEDEEGEGVFCTCKEINK